MPTQRMDRWENEKANLVEMLIPRNKLERYQNIKRGHNLKNEKYYWMVELIIKKT